jgi:ferredoxin
MKVKVDFDLCEANAMCVRAAPELFKVDENDVLHVLMEGDLPTPELEHKLKRAVRACPRAAISIEE